MDFNTGGSGGQNPNDPSRPQFGGEPAAPPRGPTGGPSGGTGGEFNLSDPVGSFVSNARKVLLNPVGFFRSIARRGDFVGPLVFAVICALISGLLSGLLGFLLALIGGDIGTALVGLLSGIFLTPIVTVIGLFIGAGVYHLLVVLLIKPSNAGFEATFRVAAYVSVVQLVTWLAAIPILGLLVALVAGVYSIYLSVVGIREVHASTTGRAAAVVLIPTAVLVLLGLLIVAVVGAALLFGSQQQF
jgi:hypothetical protein